MFRITRKSWLLIKRYEELFSNTAKEGRRYILSEAYRCEEAWNNRFSSPVIQKLKLEDMYYELDIKFQQEGKVAAVDIDLFANAIRSDEYANELEDLVHKLRLSATTSEMLSSTPHAVIRILLELGRHEQLLNILNDRINYGIFPDYYCSCLLMDTFLKAANYTAAAKVATMEMLQEDWSNPLMTHLALYSCHMYLKSPETDLWKEDIVGEDDTEEEIKIRVKYLRNPYFDDHFDLRDPQLLLGKTLATIGIALSDSIGYSYQLMGWALYKKWHKVNSCLKELKANKQVVYQEGVTVLENELQNLGKEEAEKSSESGIKEMCIQKIEELKILGLVSNECFQTAIENKVKMIVSEHEQQMISEQCNIYQEWEKLRMDVLQKELEKVKIQNKLHLVEKEKERLAKQEEELFFFDNEQKLDLIIEKAKSAPKEDVKTKLKKKIDDENYIPPEITKRKK